MSSNRYGVDITYFKKWIARAFRDMNDYKPDELARELARMSRTADSAVIMELEFIDTDAANNTLIQSVKLNKEKDATIAQQFQELEAKERRIAELEGAIVAHRDVIKAGAPDSTLDPADPVLWQQVASIYSNDEDEEEA